VTNPNRSANGANDKRESKKVTASGHFKKYEVTANGTQRRSKLRRPVAMICLAPLKKSYLTIFSASSSCYEF
jgi:hypothetical protein